MEKARVLFAGAPVRGVTSGVSTIPIGQICVASNIRDMAEVKILDMCSIDEEGLLEEVRRFRPHHIALTLYDLTLRATRKLISRVRKEFPVPLISIGGPFATLFPDVALFQCSPDFVFAGEGEKTFREFVGLAGTGPDLRGSTKADERLRNIAGICFRDSHKKLVVSSSRSVLTAGELEEMPFEPSLAAHVKRDGIFPLSTSRGCPFTCLFCTKVHGDCYRALSARRILEILENISTLCTMGIMGPVEMIAFTDDDLVRDRMRAMELFRSIEERNFPFRGYIFHGAILSFMKVGRVDQALVEQVTRSGRWVIKLGTEAFNHRELTVLKKPHRKPDETGKLIQAFHERGVSTFHYLIASTPWTRFEDFLDNLFTAAEYHFSRGCHYDINPYLIPRPGSALYREIIEKNIPHRYTLDRVEGHPEYDYPLDIRAEILDPLVARTIQAHTSRAVKNPLLNKDDPCSYLSMARRILKNEIRRAISPGSLTRLKSLDRLWCQRYRKLRACSDRADVFRQLSRRMLA